MKDRVDFNITKNGVSVGANVTRDYFEEQVLPLITTLLADMSVTQKRRSTSKRAARPVTAAPAVKVVEQRPAPTTASVVTRTAAINSYSRKPQKETISTRILA